MLAECATVGETTADLKKKFRKTVIAGGSLKGARYLDVSAEDLAKAARSYRSDPRFQQFAKRWIASKTLGQVSHDTPVGESDKRLGSRCYAFVVAAVKWLLSKTRGRLTALAGVCLILILLVSRPMFYVVLGKFITLSVKMVLRRVLGTITLVLDAILDEVSDQLDTALLTHTSNTQEKKVVSHEPFPQNSQHSSDHKIIMHAFCILIGTLLGHQWPRAAVPPRNP